MSALPDPTDKDAVAAFGKRLKGLLRYDPSETGAAVDADLNHEFALRLEGGTQLATYAGVQTEGVRAYVWPHTSDVPQYLAMGYRIEKSGAGVVTMGIECLSETGADIKVRDHVCMSLDLEEWARRKRSEIREGNNRGLAMRKAEQATIDLTQ